MSFAELPDYCGGATHWSGSTETRALRCSRRPVDWSVACDPRGVLAEFGTQLPEGTSIRVHDSNAELRYLVVPRRPAGTEGWDAAKLEQLVTRDAMIGVTEARQP